MTSKQLFVISAFFTLLLGIAWMVFPTSLLAAWGIRATYALVYMSPRYAVLFIGNAVILWLGRKETQTNTGHAVITGCFVSATLMAGMSLSGILRSTINISGWLAFGLEALLAVGFGHFLFFKNRDANYSK